MLSRLARGKISWSDGCEWRKIIVIKRGRGEEFNGIHFSYSNPRRNMQRWRGERRKNTFVPFIHIWERRSEPSRERERENFLRGRIFPKTGSFQVDLVKRQGSSGKTKRLAFSHISPPRKKKTERRKNRRKREWMCPPPAPLLPFVPSLFLLLQVLSHEKSSF